MPRRPYQPSRSDVRMLEDSRAREREALRARVAELEAELMETTFSVDRAWVEGMRALLGARRGESIGEAANRVMTSLRALEAENTTLRKQVTT